MSDKRDLHEEVVIKHSHEFGMNEDEVKEALFSVFNLWAMYKLTAVHPANGQTLFDKRDVKSYLRLMPSSLQLEEVQNG